MYNKRVSPLSVIQTPVSVLTVPLLVHNTKAPDSNPEAFTVEVPTALFHLEVTLQRLHIVLEGFQAYWRNAAEGTGLLALEGLLHLDVARLRQLVYLHTQIARRGPRLLLDIREFGLFATDEQRHHSQSQRTHKM